MRPESDFRIAPNWPSIRKMIMTSQFSDMTSPTNFIDVVLFILTSLVTDPSFMSLSSLVLQLTISFYKGLTRNPKIGNALV